MPSVCPTPFNISNAYPIPAPSSHWGFHVADAARRGVTMCSALPPTSSLACTLYWRHVPLPPRVNLHIGTTGSPFLVSPTSSLLPAPSTSTPSTLPWPRPCCVLQPLNIHMGFHVADAARRGVTMPSVCPTPFNISNAYPIPAPSSHWGCHVADAARLPYFISCLHHVPLPPQVNLHTLACALYLHPVYTAMAPSLLRPPAP